jgi:hypothetical protein
MDKLEILRPCSLPFKLGQRQISDIKFRNVTKIQFGICRTRLVGKY